VVVAEDQYVDKEDGLENRLRIDEAAGSASKERPIDGTVFWSPPIPV